jgi:hypothetical protein
VGDAADGEDHGDDGGDDGGDLLHAGTSWATVRWARQ